jgi:hypothetical protein
MKGLKVTKLSLAAEERGSARIENKTLTLLKNPCLSAFIGGQMVFFAMG